MWWFWLRFCTSFSTKNEMVFRSRFGMYVNEIFDDVAREFTTCKSCRTCISYRILRYEMDFVMFDNCSFQAQTFTAMSRKTCHEIIWKKHQISTEKYVKKQNCKQMPSGSAILTPKYHKLTSRWSPNGSTDCLGRPGLALDGLIKRSWRGLV